MSNLLNELLLRLVKPVLALALAALVFWIATGWFGASGSVEVALLSWLAAAAFIVLIQESPI